jgi:cytidylate kinase
MVVLQRRMGEGRGVVMEGRDIGTKVFPDADVKMFLDAKPEVRAERRVQQQQEKGMAGSAQSVAAQMHDRDRRDATRAVSPLVPAADAHIIDSSSMTIDQVVAEAERLVDQKLAEQPR